VAALQIKNQKIKDKKTFILLITFPPQGSLHFFYLLPPVWGDIT